MDTCGTQSPRRSGRLQRALIGILLPLSLLLGACHVTVYEGLTEEQANAMLSTLLRYSIPAEKKTSGKKGFSVTVPEEDLIRSFELLKEYNLPRKEFNSLGSVFSGDSVITSPLEDSARLAFAISQELADTFSRIDGVLTARVHVVLATNDPIMDTRTPPSAGVFLRYTPDSQVSTLVPKIRELASNSVPGLTSDQVSVMLVPIREAVSVPIGPEGAMLGMTYPKEGRTSYTLFAILALCAVSLIGLAVLGVSLGRNILAARRAPAEKAQATEEKE